MKNFAMLILILMSACSVTPETDSAEQASFAFCNENGSRLLCWPSKNDGCEAFCQAANGTDGYCPDYTQSEIDHCLRTCDPHLCDTTFCWPNTQKICTQGERP